MRIPVGKAVYVYPESERDNFFWDGNQVVSERGAMLAEATDPKRGKMLRVILIVTGLGLICAACISKYLELRRREKEKPDA